PTARWTAPTRPRRWPPPWKRSRTRRPTARTTTHRASSEADAGVRAGAKEPGRCSAYGRRVDETAPTSTQPAHSPGRAGTVLAAQRWPGAGGGRRSAARGQRHGGRAGGEHLAALVLLPELAVGQVLAVLLVDAGDAAAAGERIAGEARTAIAPAEPFEHAEGADPVGEHLYEIGAVQVPLHEHVGVPLLLRVRLVVMDAVRVPGHGAVAEERHLRRVLFERRDLQPLVHVLDEEVLLWRGALRHGLRLRLSA